MNEDTNNFEPYTEYTPEPTKAMVDELFINIGFECFEPVVTCTLLEPSFDPQFILSF